MMAHESLGIALKIPIANLTVNGNRMVPWQLGAAVLVSPKSPQFSPEVRFTCS